MTEDTINVYGHNLVKDIMGKWSFAEIMFAAITDGERPTANQARMIDVLLTTFVDHGVTPSSLATRLTLLGAPEAMQAAISAGLCGAGSRYLGTMQLTGDLLSSALQAEADSGRVTDLPGLATEIVKQYKAEKKILPGLGHPEHKQGDPRTPKLMEIAEETGIAGNHCRLLFEIATALSNISGRNLPVNAAGLSGAIVADMGLPSEAGRGLAIVSRAAGLVGVILSEIKHPTAQGIWDGLR